MQPLITVGMLGIRPSLHRLHPRPSCRSLGAAIAFRCMVVVERMCMVNGLYGSL
ncbi:MAG TPA: hypothetical protein V6D02_03510 [Candidatus Obscuribacterales bacterium]